jgi:hypothetical protein
VKHVSAAQMSPGCKYGDVPRSGHRADVGHVANLALSFSVPTPWEKRHVRTN